VAKEQEAGVNRPERGDNRATTLSMWALEHAQDVVSIVVGVALILVSAALLIAGFVDFFRDLSHYGTVHASTSLLDQVLLVLILVEIVHTVVLSLRAHTLVPQPFIVVGLVAVIRKILFILANQVTVGTSQLALLIAMVAVFVAGLIAINRLARPRSAEPGASPEEPLV
jgi:uncharacterized membrane protein (DUF373 family)